MSSHAGVFADKTIVRIRTGIEAAVRRAYDKQEYIDQIDASMGKLGIVIDRRNQRRGVATVVAIDGSDWFYYKSEWLEPVSAESITTTEHATLLTQHAKYTSQIEAGQSVGSFLMDLMSSSSSSSSSLPHAETDHARFERAIAQLTARLDTQAARADAFAARIERLEAAAAAAAVAAHK